MAEDLLTLPSGHPQAGYVLPDLSFADQRELHEDSQEAADEAAAEAEAVAQHEHEVASAELSDAEPKAAEAKSSKESASKS